jgi:hypothetical protein
LTAPPLHAPAAVKDADRAGDGKEHSARTTLDIRPQFKEKAIAKDSLPLSTNAGATVCRSRDRGRLLVVPSTTLC